MLSFPMTLRSLSSVLLFAFSTGRLIAAEQPQTSHVEFVTTFIEQLSATEAIRESNDRELNAESSFQGKLQTMIHICTAMQLELGSQIIALKQMRLEPPFEKLIENIASFYQHKIDLYKLLANVTENFIGQPREEVNYNKLAGMLPEIRANIEFIDKTIASTLLPTIFETLKKRPDMKTLNITQAEKRMLIEKINSSFGEKLNGKKKNYYVAAASVLKSALVEFKAADE
ncbi:MAG: hypothetical protein ACR2JB_08270 [Bryobacteraceae bacterium]